MNVLSAFAGIGGFDIAFESAGAGVIGQIEIDPVATQILERHWPTTWRHDDIRSTSGPDANVDVLAGGFPCNDYSIAGRSEGIRGDHGALWWQMHRIASGENVPGLLSQSDGRDFRVIIDSLVELGYGVIWRVLDARHFGVAQARRRVFIVAHSAGRPRPEVLALGESLPGDTRQIEACDHATAGQTPASARSDCRFAFAANQRDELRLIDKSTTLTAKPGMKAQTFLAFSVYPRSGQGTEMRAQETDVATTLTARDGSLHDRGTRIVDDMRVRRLTPVECERLQGFDDDWTAGPADTHRYRMLGNAVAVPVARWIAERMVRFS